MNPEPTGRLWRSAAGVVVAGVALLFGLTAAGTVQSAKPYQLVSNVAYGPPTAQRGSNLLDIYVPKARADRPLPVFVYIHGGGWSSGNKRTLTTVNKARAMTRAGFVFVSINYRLAPKPYGFRAFSPYRVRFPVPHRDTARAIGWVNRNIGRYGGDRKRIVLAGDSAGGQIASLLATRASLLAARGVSTRQIRGVISLDSVGFDVRRLSKAGYGGAAPAIRRIMLNAFGTRAEERRNPSWAAASPIRFADPSDPPIFHVVPIGVLDRIAEAKSMADRLGQRFRVAAWLVNTSHPGVSALFGKRRFDLGLTARVIRFAKAAVDPVRPKPVIRRARLAGTAGTGRGGRIRLRISSSPEARLLICRVDNRRETVCPRVWKPDPGVHSLRVTTYDLTGQPSGFRLVRVGVPR